MQHLVGAMATIARFCGFLRYAARHRVANRGIVNMGALQAFRDHMKALVADAEAVVEKAKAEVAAAEAAVAKHTGILTIIEAEIARGAGVYDELKAVVEKFGAAAVKVL